MRINWLSYTFNKHDGYGNHGRQMIRALHLSGVDISPVSVEMLEWEGWVQRLAGLDFSKLSIALMSAGEFTSVPGRLWGFSMWETTKPPNGWGEIINNTCERFIVPSEWLIEVFRNAGVKASIPIDVIGEGIDPYEFQFIDRRNRNRPFTFLALGDRGGRKGDDLVWSAFHKAFDHKADDVRLILKSRATNHRHMDLTNNPKWLSLWREDIDSMSDVYAQADCFVIPSRGDGWCLPAREAAATGLPVIATRFGGTAVNLDCWGIPIENYRMVDCVTLGGQWAEPDIDEIVDRMRWVYDHQDEAYAKGQRASAWLHANETWQKPANDLIDLIQKCG